MVTGLLKFTCFDQCPGLHPGSLSFLVVGASSIKYTSSTRKILYPVSLQVIGAEDYALKAWQKLFPQLSSL